MQELRGSNKKNKKVKISKIKGRKYLKFLKKSSDEDEVYSLGENVMIVASVKPNKDLYVI